MGFGNLLALLFVAGLIVYVLWTMPVGQRLAQTLGLQGFRGEGSSREDRAFLLKLCGGDTAEMTTLLESIRKARPEWSDAQLHREAIRRRMRDKHGGRVA